VGISLAEDQLSLVLDLAIGRARSNEQLPELWIKRVERLGQLGVKTYIGALGGALLAKATDERVDSLTQDMDAGPRGYSLRRAGEFLAEKNEGRFHMGTTSRWPLNNSPFLRGPHRIDEFTKISKPAKPSFDLFLDCLIDLNRMSAEEAQTAFAAWLRVRMAAKEAELEAGRQAFAIKSGLDAASLIVVAEQFVSEDPEGGKRGQAFVAAVLDCAFDEVKLQSINNPFSGDVQVCRDGQLAWIVEVKQAPVEERTAFELAAEAKVRGVSLALLAVLAPHHTPLDRERIRRRAMQDHRVILEVTESVRELIGMVGVFSMTTVEQIVDQLPARYAIRMREHGISERGQKRWAELIEARTS
jgi:hypothetical protein